MGCAASTGNIDRIVHQPQGQDIWSKIADGVDTVTQDLLFKWIDYQREHARKIALKERDHLHVEGVVKLSEISATLSEGNRYVLEVKVQDTNSSCAASADTAAPRWRDTLTFQVTGKGVQVNFKLFKQGSTRGLPIALATWNLSAEQNKKNITIDLKQPFLLGRDVVGKLSFKSNFTEKLVKPVKNRGFIYADYLPVLDPNVPLPALAKPDKAFTVQDDMMQDTMKLIAIDWMLTGAENTRKTLPQPLTDRVDDGEGDEWFTFRRLHGSNPGYIKPNPNKTPEADWDYIIEWDFRKNLDPAKHLKSAVKFPLYCAVKFSVADGGKKLHPHSISYEYTGKPMKDQKNDGTVAWKKAKEVYRVFEVNTRFTYSHVGVHFNVEQYAMALYRNLSDGHPIYELLTPHFKNVITNNREVVRPKPDGVVTTADVYTFDGQIKLLQDRFASFSFKNTPQRVLPANLQDNLFENAQEIMWKMLVTYVDEYFTQHPDIAVDVEISAMSRDLQDHAINKTPGAMTINDVADLKQMCVYVIFQAIFYHAWVHWNGFDDFIPVLKYDDENPQAPPPKEQDSAENQSNMIQTFVTFMSPTLKQWPILDPELGGSERLRQLLMQNASELNPSIQVATLIMAPNT